VAIVGPALVIAEAAENARSSTIERLTAKIIAAQVARRTASGPVVVWRPLLLDRTATGMFPRTTRSAPR
jgi:hypothetical protein